MEKFCEKTMDKYWSYTKFTIEVRSLFKQADGRSDTLEFSEEILFYGTILWCTWIRLYSIHFLKLEHDLQVSVK